MNPDSTGTTKTIEDGKGKFLSHMLGCWSKPSIAMIDDLADTIKAASGRRYKPSTEFITALACLVADLLRIKHGGYDYGYHGMSPKDFPRLQVGYKPFRAVVKGLEAMGFIVWKRGFKEHTGPKAKAQATRFEATDKLERFPRFLNR